MTFTCENLHNIFNNLQMLYLHKKYISLQKFCNYVHIQIHRYRLLIWDNNCVVHLKAFYSSLMGDQFAAYSLFFLDRVRFFFSSIGNRNLAKYITYWEHKTISPKNAVEYQNCINVQNVTVMTGISGTKYYSSNCCCRSLFANMHRYETMRCSSNTPPLEINRHRPPLTVQRHHTGGRFTNAIKCFVLLENICPSTIKAL